MTIAIIIHPFVANVRKTVVHKRLRKLDPLLTMENKFRTEALNGCLDWTLRTMNIAGYWFPRGSNTKNVIAYTAYSVLIVNCTLIIYMCTEIAYLNKIFGQLEEMVDTLFLLLTHAMQCIKILTFVVHKEEVYKLLDCMKGDTFRPRNTRQFKNAVKITAYTNVIAKVLVSMVIACCLLCGAKVLIEETGTRQLPVKASFPFNTDTSPRYEIISLYQIIILMMCGCANAAMDMTAAAFISQICIQLDVLSDTLLHIKDFAELQLADNSFLSNYSNDEHIIPPQLESEMKSLLIECMKHHLQLKE